MKKIISAIISFTMLLTACLTSFAVETDDNPSKASAIIESSSAANFGSYIQNTLAPKYGYADMSDQSGNIKIKDQQFYHTFIKRNGIAGYDTADMNSDGITDMIVYRYSWSGGTRQLKADFYKASSSGNISYVNSVTILNFSTDFACIRFFAGVVKKNGKNCLVSECSYVTAYAVDYAIDYNIYEFSSGKLQKSYNIGNKNMTYYDRVILTKTLNNTNQFIKEFIYSRSSKSYWEDVSNSAFSYLKMPKASNNSLAAINKFGYQSDWGFPKTASYFDTSAEAKTFFIISVYKDHNSNDYNKYYVTVTNASRQYNNSTKKIEPVKPEQTVITLPKTGKYYGDLDADNKITAADSLLVLRASVKLVSLTSKQKTIADVDASGTVDSNDALFVLRYSVHLGNTGKTGQQVF